MKSENSSLLKTINILFKYFIKYLIKKKIIFIIFLIIFMFISINMKENNYNILEYEKHKDIFNTTPLALNKGFLNIVTTHKVKFNHYNYSSNIAIYKDLYKNISYIPISDSNYILQSTQIPKEDFSILCEDGILLDKIKYKRSKHPKISVIIPYYNQGNYSIIMVLRSIQNQSFKDIEIIFVDDGSTKEKLDDILEAMKDDNRIILLKHKIRKTILLTRVDGIRYSSGKYIIQVDQDDMYLNNLLFEQLYNKSEELNVDIIQYNYFNSINRSVFSKENINISKNILVKQPEIRTVFFKEEGKNRLSICKNRAIWNLFVKRASYIQAIEDIGDEYMNHKFRIFEDIIMMFELSQVSYSYYFYDIDGMRHITSTCGKTADKNETIENEMFLKDLLLFIKLLLYKIDPKYDRYHLFRELTFNYNCEYIAENLNKNDIDLGMQIVEAVIELERIYKNTNPELINCINILKNKFEIKL